MQVLSKGYVGRTLVCSKCYALLAYNEADIYGENLVYCPLCKNCNIIDYNKNYNGIVKNDTSTSSNE